MSDRTKKLCENTQLFYLKKLTEKFDCENIEMNCCRVPPSWLDGYFDVASVNWSAFVSGSSLLCFLCFKWSVVLLSLQGRLPHPSARLLLQVQFPLEVLELQSKASTPFLSVGH